MATVTEKDIIQHLKEKIKFHQNEVKRIETLMTAFTGDTGTTTTGRKVKAEAAQEAMEPLPAKIEKKAAKAPKATEPAPAKTAKPLEVPEKYTDNLTVNGKIAYALKEIGAGFNEDIAAAMAQYEPKSDAKKISKQISGILSTLKGKGQITAEKVGRKDKFSLAV